jgi:hypothetical protein
MNIEHSVFLFRVADSTESHEQDGETLSLAAKPRSATASGDLAMAFCAFG